jgi:transketolase
VIIDTSSLKPFYKDVLLKTAKKTGKIITLEDHRMIGSLDSSVNE